MLHDISVFGAELQRVAGRTVPENIVAVRWLDQRFEPIIEAIPAELFSQLEPAEIFHQLLEHRWYLAEEAGPDVTPRGGARRLHRRRACHAHPEEQLQVDLKDITDELPICRSLEIHVGWRRDRPRT